MKQIPITEWGECDDQTCPFNGACSLHSSAGDYRCEPGGGFTPQIFVETDDGSIWCKTTSYPAAHIPEQPFSFGDDWPRTDDITMEGFVNIKKAAEEELGRFQSGNS